MDIFISKSARRLWWMLDVGGTPRAHARGPRGRRLLKRDLPDDLKPILESWLSAVHIDGRDL